MPNTIVMITMQSVKRLIVLYPFLSYQNEVNDIRFDLAVPNCVAGHMPAYLTQREPRKSVTGKLRKNRKVCDFSGFLGRNSENGREGRG